MILSEQVYKVVRNALVGLSVPAYSDYIPDETSYPFCMYEIVSMSSDPDWAFEQDYELLTVRFNVYDRNVNPIDAINVQEEIETLFNRTHLTFVDETEGKYLICNCKVDDNITYLNEDHFWQIITDYEFVAQRDI